MRRDGRKSKKAPAAPLKNQLLLRIAGADGQLGAKEGATQTVQPGAPDAAISAVRLNALAVFASAGVDLDFVALVHKQRNSHFKTRFDFGGFEHFA